MEDKTIGANPLLELKQLYMEIGDLKKEIAELKDLNKKLRSDFKQYFRENVQTFIEEEFITKEQAEVFLDAKRLKYEIRQSIIELTSAKADELLTQQFKSIIERLRKRVFIMLDDLTKAELKKYNLTHLVDEAIKNHAANKFEDIINFCIFKAFKHISKNVRDQVKNISNLKTSTIGEIRMFLDKDFVKTEEEVLEKMKKELNISKDERLYLE